MGGGSYESMGESGILLGVWVLGLQDFRSSEIANSILDYFTMLLQIKFSYACSFTIMISILALSVADRYSFLSLIDMSSVTLRYISSFL